ncbi:MAG: prepilin-type N-terminal cleavage/methylation domain-containing protein [Candidatus Gracilibacteria bacterium]|nr:prepilin-type N-terminal cleavage/methylation domain-containing protein [Candidatus Gracilibacteria bacterium]
MILSKKAFTLIELLVSITIIIILSLMTYLPYSHYQNKAKLKLASREISQSFYEAKNMAISGIKDISSNKSVGLYLTTEAGNSNKLIFFVYPYDIDELLINNVESSQVNILKTKLIQDGININNLNGYDNLLFFFDSITGKSKVYTFTSSGKSEVDLDKIIISFSYKNAISSTLNKQIIYYKNTNIIDYN